MIDEVVSGPVAIYSGVKQLGQPRRTGAPVQVVESMPGQRATARLAPGVYTIALTDGSCGHDVTIKAGETVTDDLQLGTLYCTG